VRRGGQQMLEVVEDDERVRLPERRRLGQTEHLRHGGHDELRVGEACERDEERAVGELLQQLGGDLEGEARLPGAAGAGDRDESSLPEEPGELRLLDGAADEGVRGERQVRTVQALRGRERPAAELVEALGARQVLEAMLAEVDEVGVPDQVVGRMRHEYLAAVAGRGDPRGPVDVDAHVAVVAQKRLPGVQSHANPHGAVAEPGLHGPRRRDRVGRARERDEEAVAGRVDLDAAPGRARLSDDPPMLGQLRRVALRPALRQQHSRACDVREEEGDRA
jgi:hypothetical protein